MPIFNFGVEFDQILCVFNREKFCFWMVFDVGARVGWMLISLDFKITYLRPGLWRGQARRFFGPKPCLRHIFGCIPGIIFRALLINEWTWKLFWNLFNGTQDRHAFNPCVHPRSFSGEKFSGTLMICTSKLETTLVGRKSVQLQKLPTFRQRK